MDFPCQFDLDSSREIPLYKQLADGIRQAIRSGQLAGGDRLPATRELAARLGLNRSTVSSAYSLLEEAGLLEGQVGRGSFVARTDPTPECSAPLDWEHLLGSPGPFAPVSNSAPINFASSRPGAELFPLAEFRRITREVVDNPAVADILQLGSPYGYPPLRRYLLAQAEAAGWARPGDDLLITNGCQQALDLLARILVERAAPVLVEDPVYHGLLRVFESAGAHLIPVPVGDRGIEIKSLEALVKQYRPRLLVVTPEFQNPTGSTLGLEERKFIVELAARTGLVVIENEVYRRLRYTGKPLPSLKQLDSAGNVMAVASYSKVAFPGLRVGWVVAPRPVIARLAEAKQTCDLHSDQLSQAVLLRFAESGELAHHLERSKINGAERLAAALAGCARHLPPGTRFTRPQGGMNLWIELPAPLLAADLLQIAQERGVSFLPGDRFSQRREHRRSFRLSFGSLSPRKIGDGLAILGDAARSLASASDRRQLLEPEAALV